MSGLIASHCYRAQFGSNRQRQASPRRPRILSTQFRMPEVEWQSSRSESRWLESHFVFHGSWRESQSPRSNPQATNNERIVSRQSTKSGMEPRTEKQRHFKDQGRGSILDGGNINHARNASDDYGQTRIENRRFANRMKIESASSGPLGKNRKTDGKSM